MCVCVCGRVGVWAWVGVSKVPLLTQMHIQLISNAVSGHGPNGQQHFLEGLRAFYPAKQPTNAKTIKGSTHRNHGPLEALVGRAPAASCPGEPSQWPWQGATAHKRR